jgi:hypothetical protein
MILISCSKDDNDYVFKASDTVSAKIDSANIQWYYFSEDGFTAVQGPNYAPGYTKAPWTEAIRISSANNASYKNSKKAFALVNRLGVLCFDGSKVSLAKDVKLFPLRTADNLVFVEGVPVFSVYKSAFFNDSINNDEYKKKMDDHLFLLQFDERAKITYPLLNCNNLTEDLEVEVVDFNWNGELWNCCLKNMERGKFLYQYLTIRPTASVLSITPSNAGKKIVTTSISQDEFRQTEALKNFDDAPLEIQQLLGGFTGKNAVTVEVKEAGGPSPEVYSNNINQAKNELKGKATICENWCAVLFRDGTFYFKGAMDSKRVLNDGNCIALRLPKLPSGYCYQDFVISGPTLYASWEETSFYETTKSGFLAIDLENTLYGQFEENEKVNNRGKKK